MLGCLSYVITRDPADGHGVWITEAPIGRLWLIRQV